jgi:hypothetical protein
MTARRTARLARLTSANQHHHGDTFIVAGVRLVGHLYGAYRGAEFGGVDTGLIEPTARLYRSDALHNAAVGKGSNMLHEATGASYTVVLVMAGENEPWVEYKLRPDCGCPPV